MSYLADCMRRPIAVQGKDIIIIPDLVGPVPISEQHQYVESAGATNTCPAIHVRETDLEEMRERYPDYPVYGLWQLLINSGLVSFKRVLQIIPINSQDGYYIHCDLGRAEYSGIYESAFFAADAGFSLDEAKLIDADPDKIVLPTQEAKLASELSSERKLVTRKAWSYLVIMVFSLVAISFVMNFVLAKIYDRAHRQMESQSVVLHDLQAGLDRLRTSRLTEVPNNQMALERLAVLWSSHPQIETDGQQSLSEKQLALVIVSGKKNIVDQTTPWLFGRYDPKGFWKVNVQIKGD